MLSSAECDGSFRGVRRLGAIALIAHAPFACSSGGENVDRVGHIDNQADASDAKLDGIDDRRDAVSEDGHPTGACEVRSETYTISTVFPFGDPSTQPLSECLPTCGVEPYGDGFYKADALPAGSCDNSWSSCTMAAHGLCPCPSDRGPVNGYECSCIAGRWSCVITSPGASVCSGGTCDADSSASDAGG